MSVMELSTSITLLLKLGLGGRVGLQKLTPLKCISVNLTDRLQCDNYLRCGVEVFHVMLLIVRKDNYLTI